MRPITFSLAIREGSIIIILDNDRIVNLGVAIGNTGILLQAFADAFDEKITQTDSVIIKAITTSVRKTNGAE